MPLIKSVLLLLLSINLFNTIHAKNSTLSISKLFNSSGMNKIDEEIELDNSRDNESELLVINQLLNETIMLENVQSMSKSKGYLNFTQNYVKDELNSTKTLEDFQEFNTNNHEFSTFEMFESTVPSINSSFIDEVLLNNTNESVNYQRMSDGDTDIEKQGPHHSSGEEILSISEPMDYEMNDKESESLMTLIFNEFRVNNSVHQDMTPDKKFVDLFVKLRKLYNLVMSNLTPLFIEKILTARISFGCVSGLATAYQAFNNNQYWIFKMLDSNGHFPSGLMSGTLTSLGDYDQCLSVENQEHDISGKYCLMKIKSELPEKKKIITFKDRFISLNGTELHNTWIDELLVQNLYHFYYFSITNGICVPSSCSPIDLVTIARQFLDPFHLQVEVENCATKESITPHMNSGQTTTLAIIMGFISVSFLATILDLIFVFNSHKYHNIFTQIIECFSLRQNITKFFDTSSLSHKSYAYNLQFIDGLKVLSMIWVIIGHTYISGAILFNKDIPTANFYFANLVDTINLPKQLLTQFVINALLAVDTFFFISGFLVVYLAVIRIVHDKQQVNFPLYLFMRWIRFSPMLIGIISMNLLWPLLGSGPLFHQNYIKHITGPCYKFWWRNLLFISNWYPPEEQCMIHTWYLSADFQYYIIAFFIIKLTSTNVKNGIMACSFLVLLGIAMQTLVAFWNNLPPAILYQADIENMALHISLMHIKSYNHLTSYFLGAFVACLLLRKKKFYINNSLRCFIWAFTCASSLFVVFITYIWMGLEWKYTPLGAALYFGLHRFIWTAGLAWVAFNCAQNSAGIVNSILSSSIFKLTSRLTFSLYLSHMIIIWFNFFRTKHLLFSTHYDLMFNCAGVYLFTLVFAFINHIIFELPVVNLVRFIMDTKRYTNKK